MKAVKRMLNLNCRDNQLDWRVLIIDDAGQSVIALLLNPKDIKMNHSVTLKLNISAEHEAIPGVASVYFLRASDDNVKQICDDLRRRLYHSYYYNFIDPISKSQLKCIADAALESESAHDVKAVHIQYLDYICLEDDLFILRDSVAHQLTYHDIHRTDTSDSEILAIIDSIVNGLFSVICTLDVAPIIRSSKGGPAEEIANRLCNKLRSHLEDYKPRQKTRKDQTSDQPLLCLVDRSQDLSTPLHHTWTFQALMHDVLDYEQNKVKLLQDAESLSPTAQVFDLQSDDKFWHNHRGRPFPEVADAVQQELDSYKIREEQIRRMESEDDDNDVFGESKNVVTSVKELREQKRIIAMHTTIAHAILDHIKSRRLDNFFEVEEKIMSRSPVDRVIIDDMLADPNYGQPEDKLRLFLIAYICDNPNYSDEEAEQYASVLMKLGCDRSAFDYIKRWKANSRSSVMNLQSNLKAGGGGILKTAHMFSKLMSQGSQFVMEGVKNLVLKEHLLPITKIVDALMDSSKPNPEALSYTYLDPKSSPQSTSARKKTFQNAIVFVVGGGNYIEYQNLIDYQKSRSKGLANEQRSIIYGSTELTNAGGFLRQLSMLGQSMNQ